MFFKRELLGYWQAGKLPLPVQAYPLAAVQTALRDREARRTYGKVVLLF